VHSYEQETVSTKTKEMSVLLDPRELASGLQCLLMSGNGVCTRNTTVPTGFNTWFVSSTNHKWLQSKEEDIRKASNTSRYTNIKTDVSVPES